MDVADEPGQPEQTQQAEDLSEAHDTEGPGRLVHLRVDPLFHNEKDIIHGYGRDKVHHEPAFQILHLDLLRVEDDLSVIFEHDPRPEVEDQVYKEEGVGDNIEDDPGGGGLVFEEGDAHRDDDQVTHHEHEHGKVPVEPGTHT